MMGNVPIAEPIMRIMGRDIAKGASVPLFPPPARTAIRLLSLPWHWSPRCSMTSILRSAPSEQRFFAAGRLLPSVRLHLANQVLLI